MPNGERYLRWLSALIPVGVLWFVLAGAVAALFSGELDFPRIRDELLSVECLSAVRITLFCTLGSVALAWILAVPLAVFFRARNSAVLRAGVLLPGMGHALLTLGLLRVFGVEDLYSLRSVVLAWSLAGALYLASGWVVLLRDLDGRQKEALRVIGAGPVRAFFLHDFLRTWPGQAQLLLQQIWFCFTSFSLVLILNGGPPRETLEVAIYSALRLGGGSLERAVALALWQGGLLLLLRMVWKILHPGGAGGTGEWTQAAQATKPVSWLWALPVLGAFSGYLGFLAQFATSLVLGLAVALACAAFAFSCYFSGWRRWVEASSWTSPMILSFLVWGFWNGRMVPGFNVLVLQTIIFAPWFSRSVFPILDRVRAEELQAARVLGASRVRAWMGVEWPRVRPAVIRCMGLVFSLSLMEVTSVLLFSRGDFETLSTHAQGLFMRFRMGEAAMATVFLLLTAFAVQFFTEETA